MHRREFVKLTGAGMTAGALAETLVQAQVARTPAASKAASSSNVKFKVGVAQELPFADGYFDVAILSWTL